MKRGGCKFGDGKTMGCLWPKRGAVVSKLVPQLKESVPRDAIFPDFSGIPDFHKFKFSMKTCNFSPKLER